MIFDDLSSDMARILSVAKVIDVFEAIAAFTWLDKSSAPTLKISLASSPKSASSSICLLTALTAFLISSTILVTLVFSALQALTAASFAVCNAVAVAATSTS